MVRKSKASQEKKRAKVSVKAPKGARAAKIRRSGGRRTMPNASEQLAAYQLAHMKARDAQEKPPAPTREEQYIAAIKKPMFGAQIVRKAGSEARAHFKDLYAEYPEQRDVIEKEENQNIYGRVYDALQRQHNDYDFNRNMARYAAAREEGRHGDAMDLQDEAVHKYIHNMREEEAMKRGYSRSKHTIENDLHLHKQERTDVPMQTAPSPSTPSSASSMPSVHSTPPAPAPAPQPAAPSAPASPMSGQSGGGSPVQVNISISGGSGGNGSPQPSVHVNQSPTGSAGSGSGNVSMHTASPITPAQTSDVHMQSPVSQTSATSSDTSMSSPRTLPSGFYEEDHPDEMRE